MADAVTRRRGMTVRRSIEHVHRAGRHRVDDARARRAARTQASIHRSRTFGHRGTRLCPTGTGSSPTARAHPLAGCADTAGGIDLSAHAAARATFAAAATSASAARSAVRAVTRAAPSRRCTAWRRASAAACMVSAGRSHGANTARVLVSRRGFPAAAAERQDQRESQRARARHRPLRVPQRRYNQASRQTRKLITAPRRSGRARSVRVTVYAAICLAAPLCARAIGCRDASSSFRTLVRETPRNRQTPTPVHDEAALAWGARAYLTLSEQR